ncbi:MAG TPA: hypothetical protein VJU16_04975 [Planctomycetota bacterium]|nr:hypothetical protein [Planctomycetota bacterium]
MGFISRIFESFTVLGRWTSSRRLERIVAALADRDPGARQQALKDFEGLELVDFLRTIHIAPATGIKMLRAATKKYTGELEAKEINSKLIRLLWKSPHPDFVPVIEEIYDKLEGREEARESALRLLTELGTPEALSLFSRLLRRTSSRTIDTGWILVHLKPSKELASRFLPELLAAIPNVVDRGTLYNFALEFANEGLVDLGAHAAFADLCVNSAEGMMRMHREAIDAHSRWLDRIDRPPEDDPAADELSGRFHELEVLVDFLGHHSSPRSQEFLVRLLGSKSFRLRLFAIGSLLRRRSPIDDTRLEKEAELPRPRALLWNVLEGVGALDRFPARYRTQELLAEAAMCQWLEFPTEMGCAPEELRKLAKIRTVYEGKTVVVYFFKFRERGFNKNEWLVGLAGPYPEAGPPGLNGRNTFSKFAPLDKMTLDEHIRDYVGSDTLYTILER